MVQTFNQVALSRSSWVPGIDPKLTGTTISPFWPGNDYMSHSWKVVGTSKFGGLVGKMVRCLDGTGIFKLSGKKNLFTAHQFVKIIPIVGGQF